MDYQRTSRSGSRRGSTLNANSARGRRSRMASMRLRLGSFVGPAAASGGTSVGAPAETPVTGRSVTSAERRCRLLAELDRLDATAPSLRIDAATGTNRLFTRTERVVEDIYMTVEHCAVPVHCLTFSGQHVTEDLVMEVFEAICINVFNDHLLRTQKEVLGPVVLRPEENASIGPTTEYVLKLNESIAADEPGAMQETAVLLAVREVLVADNRWVLSDVRKTGLGRSGIKSLEARLSAAMTRNQALTPRKRARVEALAMEFVAGGAGDEAVQQADIFTLVFRKSIDVARIIDITDEVVREEEERIFYERQGQEIAAQQMLLTHYAGLCANNITAAPADRQRLLQEWMGAIELAEIPFHFSDFVGRTLLHWAVAWSGSFFDPTPTSTATTAPTTIPQNATTSAPSLGNYPPPPSTAAVRAARSKHEIGYAKLRSMILFCTEAGISPLQCDNAGESAVDLARGCGLPAAMEILREIETNFHRRVSNRLPVLEEPVYESAATDRIAQVAFSATQPHVFFTLEDHPERGACVMLYDMRLERTLLVHTIVAPAAGGRGAGGAADMLLLQDGSLNRPESPMLTMRQEKSLGDTQHTMPYASQATFGGTVRGAGGAAHKELPAKAAAHRLMVVPFFIGTHGTTTCDILVVSDGHWLTVDHAGRRYPKIKAMLAPPMGTDMSRGGHGAWAHLDGSDTEDHNLDMPSGMMAGGLPAPLLSPARGGSGAALSRSDSSVSVGRRVAQQHVDQQTPLMQLLFDIGAEGPAEAANGGAMVKIVWTDRHRTDPNKIRRAEHDDDVAVERAALRVAGAPFLKKLLSELAQLEKDHLSAQHHPGQGSPDPTHHNSDDSDEEYAEANRQGRDRNRTNDDDDTRREEAFARKLLLFPYGPRAPNEEEPDTAAPLSAHSEGGGGGGDGSSGTPSPLHSTTFQSSSTMKAGAHPSHHGGGGSSNDTSTHHGGGPPLVTGVGSFQYSGESSPLSFESPRNAVRRTSSRSTPTKSGGRGGTSSAAGRQVAGALCFVHDGFLFCVDIYQRDLIEDTRTALHDRVAIVFRALYGRMAVLASHLQRPAILLSGALISQGISCYRLPREAVGTALPMTASQSMLFCAMPNGAILQYDPLAHAFSRYRCDTPTARGAGLASSIVAVDCPMEALTEETSSPATAASGRTKTGASQRTTGAAPKSATSAAAGPQSMTQRASPETAGSGGHELSGRGGVGKQPRPFAPTQGAMVASIVSARSAVTPTHSMGLGAHPRVSEPLVGGSGVFSAPRSDISAAQDLHHNAPDRRQTVSASRVVWAGRGLYLRHMNWWRVHSEFPYDFNITPMQDEATTATALPGAGGGGALSSERGSLSATPSMAGGSCSPASTCFNANGFDRDPFARMDDAMIHGATGFYGGTGGVLSASLGEVTDADYRSKDQHAFEDAGTTCAAVSYHDPNGIYFTREGVLSRWDTRRRRAAALFRIRLSEGEMAQRARDLDFASRDLSTGAEVITFNIDGSLMVRYSPTYKSLSIYDVSSYLYAESERVFADLVCSNNLIAGTASSSLETLTRPLVASTAAAKLVSPRAAGNNALIARSSAADSVLPTSVPRVVLRGYLQTLSSHESSSTALVMRHAAAVVNASLSDVSSYHPNVRDRDGCVAAFPVARQSAIYDASLVQDIFTHVKASLGSGGRALQPGQVGLTRDLCLAHWEALLRLGGSLHTCDNKGQTAASLIRSAAAPPATAEEAIYAYQAEQRGLLSLFGAMLAELPARARRQQEQRALRGPLGLDLNAAGRAAAAVGTEHRLLALPAPASITNHKARPAPSGSASLQASLLPFHPVISDTNAAAASNGASRAVYFVIPGVGLCCQSLHPTPGAIPSPKTVLLPMTTAAAEGWTFAVVPHADMAYRDAPRGDGEEESDEKEPQGDPDAWRPFSAERLALPLALPLIPHTLDLIMTSDGAVLSVDWTECRALPHNAADASRSDGPRVHFHMLPPPANGGASDKPNNGLSAEPLLAPTHDAFATTPAGVTWTAVAAAALTAKGAIAPGTMGVLPFGHQQAHFICSPIALKPHWRGDRQSARRERRIARDLLRKALFDISVTSSSATNKSAGTEDAAPPARAHFVAYCRKYASRWVGECMRLRRIDDDGDYLPDRDAQSLGSDEDTASDIFGGGALGATVEGNAIAAAVAEVAAQLQQRPSAASVAAAEEEAMRAFFVRHHVDSSDSDGEPEGPESGALDRVPWTRLGEEEPSLTLTDASTTTKASQAAASAAAAEPAYRDGITVGTVLACVETSDGPHAPAQSIVVEVPIRLPVAVVLKLLRDRLSADLGIAPAADSRRVSTAVVASTTTANNTALPAMTGAPHAGAPYSFLQKRRREDWSFLCQPLLSSLRWPAAPPTGAAAHVGVPMGALRIGAGEMVTAMELHAPTGAALVTTTHVVSHAVSCYVGCPAQLGRSLLEVRRQILQHQPLLSTAQHQSTAKRPLTSLYDEVRVNAGALHVLGGGSAATAVAAAVCAPRAWSVLQWTSASGDVHCPVPRARFAVGRMHVAYAAAIPTATHEMPPKATPTTDSASDAEDGDTDGTMMVPEPQDNFFLPADARIGSQRRARALTEATVFVALTAETTLVGRVSLEQFGCGLHRAPARPVVADVPITLSHILPAVEGSLERMSALWHPSGPTLLVLRNGLLLRCVCAPLNNEDEAFRIVAPLPAIRTIGALQASLHSSASRSLPPPERSSSCVVTLAGETHRLSWVGADHTQMVITDDGLAQSTTTAVDALAQLFTRETSAFARELLVKGGSSGGESKTTSMSIGSTAEDIMALSTLADLPPALTVHHHDDLDDDSPAAGAATRVTSQQPSISVAGAISSLNTGAAPTVALPHTRASPVYFSAFRSQGKPWLLLYNHICELLEAMEAPAAGGPNNGGGSNAALSTGQRDYYGRAVVHLFVYLLAVDLEGPCLGFDASEGMRGLLHRRLLERILSLRCSVFLVDPVTHILPADDPRLQAVLQQLQQSSQRRSMFAAAAGVGGAPTTAAGIPQSRPFGGESGSVGLVTPREQVTPGSSAADPHGSMSPITDRLAATNRPTLKPLNAAAQQHAPTHTATSTSPPRHDGVLSEIVASAAPDHCAAPATHPRLEMPQTLQLAWSAAELDVLYMLERDGTLFMAHAPALDRTRRRIGTMGGLGSTPLPRAMRVVAMGSDHCGATALSSDVRRRLPVRDDMPCDVVLFNNGAYALIYHRPRGRPATEDTAVDPHPAEEERGGGLGPDEEEDAVIVECQTAGGLQWVPDVGPSLMTSVAQALDAVVEPTTGGADTAAGLMGAKSTSNISSMVLRRRRGGGGGPAAASHTASGVEDFLLSPPSEAHVGMDLLLFVPSGANVASGAEPVGIAVASVAYGEVRVLRLYAPPGVTRVFARHIPAMLQQALRGLRGAGSLVATLAPCVNVLEAAGIGGGPAAQLLALHRGVRTATRQSLVPDLAALDITSLDSVPDLPEAVFPYVKLLLPTASASSSPSTDSPNPRLVIAYGTGADTVVFVFEAPWMRFMGSFSAMDIAASGGDSNTTGPAATSRTVASRVFLTACPALKPAGGDGGGDAHASSGVSYVWCTETGLAICHDKVPLPQPVQQQKGGDGLPDLRVYLSTRSQRAPITSDAASSPAALIQSTCVAAHHPTNGSCVCVAAGVLLRYNVNDDTVVRVPRSVGGLSPAESLGHVALHFSSTGRYLYAFNDLLKTVVVFDADGLFADERRLQTVTSLLPTDGSHRGHCQQHRGSMRAASASYTNSDDADPHREGAALTYGGPADGVTPRDKSLTEVVDDQRRGSHSTSTSDASPMRGLGDMVLSAESAPGSADMPMPGVLSAPPEALEARHQGAMAPLHRKGGAARHQGSDEDSGVQHDALVAEHAARMHTAAIELPRGLLDVLAAHLSGSDIDWPLAALTSDAQEQSDSGNASECASVVLLTHLRRVQRTHQLLRCMLVDQHGGGSVTAPATATMHNANADPTRRPNADPLEVRDLHGHNALHVLVIYALLFWLAGKEMLAVPSRVRHNVDQAMATLVSEFRQCFGVYMDTGVSLVQTALGGPLAGLTPLDLLGIDAHSLQTSAPHPYNDEAPQLMTDFSTFREALKASALVLLRERSEASQGAAQLRPVQGFVLPAPLPSLVEAGCAPSSETESPAEVLLFATRIDAADHGHDPRPLLLSVYCCGAHLIAHARTLEPLQSDASTSTSTSVEHSRILHEFDESIPAHCRTACPMYLSQDASRTKTILLVLTSDGHVVAIRVATSSATALTLQSFKVSALRRLAGSPPEDASSQQHPQNCYVQLDFIHSQRSVSVGGPHAEPRAERSGSDRPVSASSGRGAAAAAAEQSWMGMPASLRPSSASRSVGDATTPHPQSNGTRPSSAAAASLLRPSSGVRRRLLSLQQSRSQSVISTATSAAPTAVTGPRALPRSVVAPAEPSSTNQVWVATVAGVTAAGGLRMLSWSLSPAFVAGMDLADLATAAAAALETFFVSNSPALTAEAPIARLCLTQGVCLALCRNGGLYAAHLRGITSRDEGSDRTAANPLSTEGGGAEAANDASNTAAVNSARRPPRPTSARMEATRLRRIALPEAPIPHTGGHDQDRSATAMHALDVAVDAASARTFAVVLLSAGVVVYDAYLQCISLSSPFQVDASPAASSGVEAEASQTQQRTRLWIQEGPLMTGTAAAITADGRQVAILGLQPPSIATVPLRSEVSAPAEEQASAADNGTTSGDNHTTAVPVSRASVHPAASILYGAFALTVDTAATSATPQPPPTPSAGAGGGVPTVVCYPTDTVLMAATTTVLVPADYDSSAAGAKEGDEGRGPSLNIAAILALRNTFPA